jgi:hypothetical protein
VYLDGDLIGMHGFSLEPSSQDRINRLGRASSRAASPRRYIMSDEPSSPLQADRRSITADDDDEEVPMSLEQLLRNQKHQHGG